MIKMLIVANASDATKEIAECCSSFGITKTNQNDNMYLFLYSSAIINPACVRLEYNDRESWEHDYHKFINLALDKEEYIIVAITSFSGPSKVFTLSCPVGAGSISHLIARESH